ncbi:hypothetical protein [Streptomyces sp. NPDC058667]|uniref:hypothetical protein n=1 Tax=Streptomyces sp. NPDC058667 TaxID=3346588 RepID=UPI003660879B
MTVGDENGGEPAARSAPNMTGSVPARGFGHLRGAVGAKASEEFRPQDSRTPPNRIAAPFAPFPPVSIHGSRKEVGRRLDLLCDTGHTSNSVFRYRTSTHPSGAGSALPTCENTTSAGQLKISIHHFLISETIPEALPWCFQDFWKHQEALEAQWKFSKAISER